jgi:hypothetical protein
MKRNGFGLMLVLLPAVWLSSQYAGAQGSPTADRQLQLSAFGAASGVFTGLEGGKNLSFTGGVDFGLLSHHGLRPVVEVRGTLPLKKGTIDAEKSVLGGVRVDFFLGHRVHPYGDFLFGRGETDYLTGYVYNNYLYALTSTNIISPGGGLEYDLNENLALKLDGQFQHWGAAPTPSGSVYSTVATAGATYRFDFSPKRKRR